MVPPPGNVTNIAWSTEGSGNASFSAPPTGPTAVQWDLGDLLPNIIPGPITFKVTITYDDGHKECGQFDSEIGVRTDDVILVGWINPAGVTLPTGPPPTGPNAWIPAIMPPTGPPVPSSLSCNDLVGDLSFADITPNGNPLVGADRTYLLNWLFKYAGNTDPSLIIPGGDFRNIAGTAINEAEVSNFVGVKTNFKLFNRLQIKFTADASIDVWINLPITGELAGSASATVSATIGDISVTGGWELFGIGCAGNSVTVTAGEATGDITFTATLRKDGVIRGDWTTTWLSMTLWNGLP